MNDDFDIIQELSIGDKIKREKEILSLMETMDPMSNDYSAMMSELSEIMKSKFEFLSTYSNNLKEKN